MANPFRDTGGKTKEQTQRKIGVQEMGGILPNRRWCRSGAMRDLPTIAFFRASALLRRSGPVPGILAAHWPGAIMDKSGRRFVSTFN
jgi:hypothetical protein